MAHYKSATNEIYWYDTDAEFTEFAPVGLTLITDAEALILQMPPAPTVAELLLAYQELAKTALAATDSTFARIQEAITLGLVINTDAVVVEWINYRKALRTEMKATTVNILPTKPTTYPTGT